MITCSKFIINKKEPSGPDCTIFGTLLYFPEHLYHSSQMVLFHIHYIIIFIIFIIQKEGFGHCPASCRLLS